MSLKKTVSVWVVAWAAVISTLHVRLNLDLFRKTDGPTREFKVGFLPVT